MFNTQFLLISALIPLFGAVRIASEFPMLQTSQLAQYLTSSEPSDWLVVPKSTADGYLILEQYYDSSTCGNDVAVMFGFALGVCTPGTDDNGNAGSLLRTQAGESGKYIRFTEVVYTTSDCTGSSVSNIYIVPASCIGDTGDFGLIYSLSDSVAPWPTDGAGFLVKSYLSSSSCASETSTSDFAWYDLGGCLPNARGVALSFVSCDKSTRTGITTTFSDKSCTTPIASRESSLQLCTAVTYSYAGLFLTGYQTVSCV